ncbi:unnamed protein product [Mesocestoides corti]|uniref:Ubiquitin-like domain-containing protein n=1 Tax=Mesocestoides corti TaxID=53468 RepID=A0A0R3UMS3_MESCO|nr:unnamed protein product [Mesocestoides corti]
MTLRLAIIHRDKILTPVTIDEDATVSDLKFHIADLINVAPEAQTLTFDGVLLENWRQLKLYKFPAKAALSLDVPLDHSSKFKIFVKLPSRTRPLKLRVGMATTLGDVKRILSQTQNLPLDQQVLVYKSCVFDAEDDNRLLASLKIAANAKLEVFLTHSRSDRRYTESEDFNSKPASVKSDRPSGFVYADIDSEVAVGCYRLNQI